MKDADFETVLSDMLADPVIIGAIRLACVVLAVVLTVRVVLFLLLRFIPDRGREATESEIESARSDGRITDERAAQYVASRRLAHRDEYPAAPDQLGRFL